MEYRQTAPNCIAEGCDQVSALSSVACDKFFTFTTFFCSDCYKKLLTGEDLVIDTSRLIVSRTASEGSASWGR